MHQMHILTKKCLFSNAQAEKFGNVQCYDCKDPKNPERHEMEPNQLKDKKL
jgi:hypothetical protein